MPRKKPKKWNGPDLGVLEGLDRERVLQVLTTAREYLERGWIQGVAARSITGEPCSHSDPNACRWCLTGAVSRAAFTNKWQDCYPYLTAIISLLASSREDARWVCVWNDQPGRTQEEVIELVNRCIEAAQCPKTS